MNIGEIFIINNLPLIIKLKTIFITLKNKINSHNKYIIKRSFNAIVTIISALMLDKIILGYMMRLLHWNR